MAQPKLVEYRIFGSDRRPTIYYVVGFRARINQFIIPIQVLKLAGYRIVAFQVDPRVLMAGDPELLGQALDELMQIVRHDMPGRKIAGTYGISLGSFFALNILTLDRVDKIFMNTGGGSVLQAVWEMPVLMPERQAFEDNGYSREDVGRYWNPIDISQNIHKISGKTMLANASYADEYIPIKDVLRHVEDWQKAGVKAQIILVKHLSHIWLIVTTLLKFRKTIRFFR